MTKFQCPFDKPAEVLYEAREGQLTSLISQMRYTLVTRFGAIWQYSRRFLASCLGRFGGASVPCSTP